MTNILLTTVDSRPNVLFPYRILDNNLIRFSNLQLDISASEPIVQRHELATVILYGRLYIVHLFSQRQEMTFYRFERDNNFYRDRQFNMFSSGPFDVSVVDNLLLLHNRQDCLTMLFDKRSRTDMPICPPMPISRYVPYNADLRYASTTQERNDDSKENNAARTTNAESNKKATVDADEPTEVLLYSPSWIFIYPNMVLDKESGFMFELQPLLTQMSINTDNKTEIIRFFFRRANSKSVLLQMIRSFIEQNETLSRMATLFRLINSYLRFELDHTASRSQSRHLCLDSRRKTSRSLDSQGSVNISSPTNLSPNLSFPDSPQRKTAGISSASGSSGVGTFAFNIASGLRDLLNRDKPPSNSPPPSPQQKSTMTQFTAGHDENSDHMVLHQLGYPAITQMDMCNTVFTPLNEEQVCSPIVTIAFTHLRTLLLTLPCHDLIECQQV